MRTAGWDFTWDQRESLKGQLGRTKKGQPSRFCTGDRSREKGKKKSKIQCVARESRKTVHVSHDSKSFLRNQATFLLLSFLLDEWCDLADDSNRPIIHFCGIRAPAIEKWTGQI